MSAINIFNTPTGVHVVTDGAAYTSDGTLCSVVQKAHPVAHLRMVISVRGPSIATPLLAEAIQNVAVTFDDAIEKLADIVRDAVETYSNVLAMCSLGSGMDILIAGWSESADAGKIFLMATHEASGNVPWVVKDVSQLMISPHSAELEERLKDQGAKLDMARNHVNDVAVTLMEAQRHVAADQGEGYPVYGVGCFCQVTTITRDGITSRILRRWPDAIGVPLQPVPATHDDAGEPLEPWFGQPTKVANLPPTAAMSREQQRRMKQMQRRAR